MAALSESELPHAGRGAALAWRLASDSALARAVAVGNDAAFAALYDRYHAPLLRYCRSMLLGADDAQDAAQNALTAALHALRSPERATPLHLKPWLYRIAHNEALRVIRGRPAVAAVDEEVAAPDDGAARAELRELLDDLNTLPGRQRSALVLRELEGLSYHDVGAALAMSEEAARTAVFEARNALWAQRDGRGSTCEDVRRKLSGGDGRTARSRVLRAHLDDCELCAAYAAQIRARRRSLRALFPLPGIVVAGSGSGWALFGGATVATKCAALCATAVVVGGSVAALETTHRHRDGGPASATAVATPSPPAPRAASPAPRARTAAALVVPARTTARRPAAVPKPRTPKARRVHRITAVRASVVTTVAPKRSSAPATTTSTPAPPPAQAQESTPPQQASTTTTAQSTPAPPTTSQRIQTALAQTQDRVRETVTTVATGVQTLLTRTQEQLRLLRERLQTALSGPR